MWFWSHFIFYLSKQTQDLCIIVHPRIVRNISGLLPLDSLQPVTERYFKILEEKICLCVNAQFSIHIQ